MRKIFLTLRVGLASSQERWSLYREQYVNAVVLMVSLSVCGSGNVHMQLGHLELWCRHHGNIHAIKTLATAFPTAQFLLLRERVSLSISKP